MVDAVMLRGYKQVFSGDRRRVLRFLQANTDHADRPQWTITTRIGSGKKEFLDPDTYVVRFTAAPKE